MSTKIHAGLAYVGGPGPPLNYWGGGGRNVPPRLQIVYNPMCLIPQ